MLRWLARLFKMTRLVSVTCAAISRCGCSRSCGYGGVASGMRKL